MYTIRPTDDAMDHAPQGYANSYEDALDMADHNSALFQLEYSIVDHLGPRRTVCVVDVRTITTIIRTNHPHLQGVQL